jgi:uncharacterized phage protein (TIGR01671 family)
MSGYIVEDGHNSWLVPSKVKCLADMKCRIVIKTTIAQYTGLKDKNGKEIYEGDVVTNTTVKREWICPKNNRKPYYRNMKRKTRGIIKWDDHWACWDFTKKTERGELEIIGNIYENPELVDNGR